MNATDLVLLTSWIDREIADGATRFDLRDRDWNRQVDVWLATNPGSVLAPMVVACARAFDRRNASAWATARAIMIRGPAAVEIARPKRTLLVLSTKPTGLGILRLVMADGVARPEPDLSAAEVRLERLRLKALAPLRSSPIYGTEVERLERIAEQLQPADAGFLLELIDALHFRRPLGRARGSARPEISQEGKQR